MKVRHSILILCILQYIVGLYIINLFALRFLYNVITTISDLAIWGWANTLVNTFNSSNYTPLEGVRSTQQFTDKNPFDEAPLHACYITAMVELGITGQSYRASVSRSLVDRV